MAKEKARKMIIKFAEIQNFRKLKSIRIDFSPRTTLFVGANNSGKTAAMVSLGHFLVDNSRFTMNDVTLSNWKHINKIGEDWWSGYISKSPVGDLSEIDWESAFPVLDLWLEVDSNQVHHVSHLLPTLDWDGGALGIRMRLEPKDPEILYKGYIAARSAAEEVFKKANGERKPDQKGYTVKLWPDSLVSFLEKDRKLGSYFSVKIYCLDPIKLQRPDKGVARPQKLVNGKPVEGNPFAKLIRVDEINAQRGFSDAGSRRNHVDGGAEEKAERSETKRLSNQLRSYYSRHLDPTDAPDASDLDALQAIDDAQQQFDGKLEDGFSDALKEIEELGYPGLSDPKLKICTRIHPVDGLNHASAVQYEVIQQSGQEAGLSLRLTEQYNGLGYQNLISMVFRLMSFRDDWMRVGKAAKTLEISNKELHFQPIHLVLLEEPEAHLHAQVQQVFINKAYDILRNHKNLGENSYFSTQMVISTHSSHIAHECEFSCLRYFRRRPAAGAGEVPTSTVVNLSEVFGKHGSTERFVTRYLKATHCDLFFADAAILVEGPAERMMVPYFIRNHFKELNQRYITLLEVGGSHAHRFRPLIEHLGLVTLLIADLDPAKSEEKWPVAPPRRKQNMISRNTVIRQWVPEKNKLDDLLDLSQEEKIKVYDRFFSVRVAYQTPIQVTIDDAVGHEEALSSTFEDALVFENLDFFRPKAGKQLQKTRCGLMKSFREAAATKRSAEALGAAMFDALKKGDKAAFSLDLLYPEDRHALTAPAYIREGLEWLQLQLRRKQQEVIGPHDVVS
ncbi:AAA family ATPase [Azospirillum sp. TSO5]|uniref:AAA family ATPase n=1 Tax=Azospirillum sp. TSO5 TaxID=716760 RepID=UPI001FFEF404|nr:AAA family ATPase [Azospirillum sp. TSO5]